MRDPKVKELLLQFIPYLKDFINKNFDSLPIDEFIAELSKMSENFALLPCISEQILEYMNTLDFSYSKWTDATKFFIFFNDSYYKTHPNHTTQELFSELILYIIPLLIVEKEFHEIKTLISFNPSVDCKVKELKFNFFKSTFNPFTEEGKASLKNICSKDLESKVIELEKKKKVLETEKSSHVNINNAIKDRFQLATKNTTYFQEKVVQQEKTISLLEKEKVKLTNINRNLINFFEKKSPLTCLKKKLTSKQFETMADTVTKTRGRSNSI